MNDDIIAREWSSIATSTDTDWPNWEYTLYKPISEQQVAIVKNYHHNIINFSWNYLNVYTSNFYANTLLPISDNVHYSNNE